MGAHPLIDLRVTLYSMLLQQEIGILHSTIFSHTAAADSFFCATGNEFRPIILQLAQFLCTLFPIP